ncbi:MAG: NAD(P) transhydrogenase subunit alpha, partial [Thermotogae bacterium]|nr:NAD(P) transhydrogenase subunit alpha [Thermotogota bacterium]
MAVKVGILKETWERENRVALVPLEVKKLVKKGFEVLVEKGAGERAYFFDNEYADAGAKLTDRSTVLKESDIVVKVQPPDDSDIQSLREGSVLISLMFWWKNK